MGEPTSAIRNSETTSMLDYGFNTFQMDTLVKENQILGRKKVQLGEEDYVNIVPKSSINILNNKVGAKRNVTYNLDIDDIKAPIKKGEVVGKITVLEDNKIIMEVDATVEQDIDKASIFKIYSKNLIDIMKGNI